MNPADPLAQLHPLREPAAISGWPLAPGWWLLACLALAITAALITWLWQRHRRNRYRRQGLAELQRIEARYRIDGDHRALAAAVNELLKTIALRAYPQAQVAAIHGQAWADFLNSTSGNALDFDLAAVTAHYAPARGLQEPQQLCAQAARWIRQHRGQL